MKKSRRKSTPDAAEQSGRLDRVLGQSEQVQEKVEDATVDLSSVNVVLRKEVEKSAPQADVTEAVEQAVAVELMLQEAADELVAVNDALAVEIDERVAVELQLVESQAELTVSRGRERHARHEALHDHITGLPNAALFHDRLQSALLQARRHAWKFAVMFIDLDRFKLVNDRYGHDVGDGVLRVVADRLGAFVREGDTVSRRSGDEFLYLMLEVQDLAGARAMGERIVALIGEPCVIDGVSLSVGASVGIAMFPADGTSAKALLKHADLSMYASKSRLTP
jgi:diguanylate cyclase (GGDEF)-like protein